MNKQFTPINFGPFRLTHRLAGHGAAELFIARHRAEEKRHVVFAIKRLRGKYAENPEFNHRFACQGQWLCHLNHCNILKVYELGKVEGQFYIAMEYVHGFNARQLRRVLAVRHQRLPLPLALTIILRVLTGLDHAHHIPGPEGLTRGVAHRELSPSNVLISLSGEVKISDFNLSRIYCDLGLEAGDLFTKFSYMAPEQVLGEKGDQRSDFFAVGILLAELITGHRLFEGRNTIEIQDWVLNTRMDLLQPYFGELPEDVVPIIRRAMERDVSSRYQSAGEFREAVDEICWRRRIDLSTEPLADYLNHQIIPFLRNASQATQRAMSSPHEAMVMATRDRSVQVDTDLVSSVFTPRTPAAQQRQVAAIAGEPDLFNKPTRIFTVGLPDQPPAELSTMEQDTQIFSSLRLNSMLLEESHAEPGLVTDLFEKRKMEGRTELDLVAEAPLLSSEDLSMEVVECDSTRRVDLDELRQLQLASGVPKPLLRSLLEPESNAMVGEALAAVEPTFESFTPKIVSVVHEQEGAPAGAERQHGTINPGQCDKPPQERCLEGTEEPVSGMISERQEVSGQTPYQVTSMLQHSWLEELIQDRSPLVRRASPPARGHR